MGKKIILKLVLLVAIIALSKGAVIGIDFGSEYYKAVLVKPGAPFNIVENTSSQRKTENAIAFTKDERFMEK